MLQAAERSPRMLHIRSRLSHVLTVNLLSSAQDASGKFLDVLRLMPVVLRRWAVSTAPLMQSVPDCLSRNVHISGLLKLILQDPGSARPLLHLHALRRR